MFQTGNRVVVRKEIKNDPGNLRLELGSTGVYLGEGKFVFDVGFCEALLTEHPDVRTFRTKREIWTFDMEFANEHLALLR